MLYRKSGFPGENELVVCTITKVHFNSVFVILDEYEKTGMIHISEVSPGRIRNIRDFVKEGKKVICKVLRVNREREHIDLSLRRVSEMQKREKTSWIKQEQKSEKIVEQLAKRLGKDPIGLYHEISGKIFKRYDSLTACFEEIVSGNVGFVEIGIEPDLAAGLEEAIRARIKPREVVIGGYMELTSYAPDGVEIVKHSLKKASDTSRDIEMRYLGAGRYHIEVPAPDYKEAEKTLEKATAAAISFIKEKGGQGKFVRMEK